MKTPDVSSSAAAGDAGFTLLEVLVALAILGTAVVMSIQGVSQGLRLLKAAGDQQQAVIVADNKARELLIPIEGSDSGTEGRFSWQRTSRIVETPDLTPAEAAPKWRVFQISVVVLWDEGRRLEMSTLRTVPATSDPTRATERLTTTVAPGEGQQLRGQGPGRGQEPLRGDAGRPSTGRRPPSGSPFGGGAR